jgi:hypothetical protein
LRTSLSGFGIGLLVSVLVVGCGGSTKSPEVDAKAPPSEAGAEAGGETQPDGGTISEAGAETSVEAGGEAGAEVGAEAGTEAGTEAGSETTPAAAKLEISDGPTFDFGTQATGSSTDHTFTVTNTGGSPATAVAGTGTATGPFAPKGGSFPGTGGTCKTTLAAGESCTFVVTFSPTTSALASATVGLAYNDGAAARSVMLGLAGTGAPPAVLVLSDSTAYDFGDHLIGTTSEHTFIVTNTGGVAATGLMPSALAAPLAYKGGTAPGMGGNCGATLAAGASCTLIVTFKPTAAGKTTATLTVAYTDGLASRAATRDVAGLGTQPAQLVISDGATYDFGVQGLGVAATHTFTVENQGGAAAQGLDLMGGLPAPFSLQGGSFTAAGTCRAVLAAFSSCTLTVIFKPTMTGAASATLTLAYQDGQAAATAARALTGTGTDHAHLELSDAPTYDFGTHAVDTATTHAFTLTNTGAVAASALTPATLAAPFAFAGGTYPGTAGSCGATLAAGASCTIAVTFTPTTSGAASGSLGLAYDDGFGPQSASRALAGTGTNLAFLSISDAPKYAFPTVATGSTAEHAFTVTNTGKGTASNVAGGALASPFGYKGGTYPGMAGTCGATLAAGASCTVVVTFRPASPGLPAGTLSISYDDGVATGLTATRAMSGGAASPALLSFADSPQYDFGARVVGTSFEHVFIVTNVGGVKATALQAVAPGGPFAFTGGAYPGTNGSCATDLDPGQSCTMALTFAPTAPGATSRPLGLGYGDGVATTTAGEDLVGTGLAPALLAISDEPTYDFGTTTIGGVAEHTFTVTNSGGVPATSIVAAALASPWGWKGGTYPGAGASCGATLDAGKTCTVIVTFAPTAAGAATSSLSLGYDDAVAARSADVGLAGTGAAPALLAISDGPTYDFGTRAAGSSTLHAFTVTNSGGQPAKSLAATGLAAPFAVAGGAWPGANGTCGTTLAAGGSCTVVVAFGPMTIATSTGTLGVSYDDTLNTVTAQVGLAGKSVAAALLALSDGPIYDFGTKAAGSSTSHTFTVINGGGFTATGISPTTLGAPFSFAGGTFPGTNGTCGATLAPGTSCTLAVTFAPVTSGAASDTVILGYDDGASTQVANVGLTGTGAAPALLAISDGPTYDFGTRAIGLSVDHTFTVTNSGGVAATGVAAGALATGYAFKGGTFPGMGGTCGATVAAGATCAVVVTFAPPSAGTLAATLTLSYADGAANQAASRAMTGVGASPAVLSISDGPSYDFGTRATGAAASHTFTVTNGGGVAATSISAGALAAPFAYAGGTFPGSTGSCGASLAAGATCTFVATFAPTAKTASGATVALAYNNGATSASASVNLTGTGAQPATLAISDGPTYDFGTRASGSSTDHTFTVTNNGGVPATGILAPALAAPFSYKGGGAYPGAQGTCGGTLAAGASCTFLVTFAPSSSGLSSASVGLTYDDGVTGQSASVGLAGTGAAPALLSISDGMTYDFGTKATGSITTHAFTVSNSGGVSATALSAGALGAPFTYPGGYPGTGGTCAASLGAGASCTIVVAFAPTGNGLKSSTLTVSYGDGVTTQSASRPFGGTGAAPAVLALSSSPVYDFGTRATGSTTSHTFILSASGGVDATAIVAGTLAAPFGYAGGTYPGTGGDCGATLSPSSTCTIVVSYAPGTPGAAFATLGISYSDGAAGRAIAENLTALANPPALLSISDPTTYDFGTLGTTASATHVFRVSNSGGMPATALTAGALATSYTYAGGAYPGTGGTCTTTLAAGAQCAVVVRFAPTTPGTFPGALSIGYDDGAATQSASRLLTGKGTTAAVLSISDFPPQYYTAYAIQTDPATFNFNMVGVNGTASHQFFVTNTGSAQATAISGVALSAPYSFAGGAFPGQGGNCPATLGVGVTCAVVVSFHPTTATSTPATLKINYNDGTDPQSATRPMTGAGTNGPALAIYDFPTGNADGVNIGPSWDYGVRGLGIIDDHQFFVVNTGGGTAISLSSPAMGNGFAYRGGTYPGTNGSCGTTLAPGAACVLDVAFAPTTVGPAASKILLNYTDTPVTGTFQASRNVQGVGTNLASLEIWIDNQPFSELVYDYGFHATSTSTGHTFNLVNAGGAKATSISPALLPAPFAYAGGTYPGQGGTCGTSLDQGTGCTLVVVYAPTVSGTANATISVSYDDSSGATRSARRDVTGTATSYALLTINNWPFGGGGGNQPDPFEFGTSGVPVDHTFELRNDGAQSALSLAGVAPAAPFSFKGGSFPGQGGTCGSSLAKGASCMVVVTFSGAATGASKWAATYLDGSGGTATAERNVTGTSISTALIQVTDCPECGFDPNPSDFGTTGTAQQRTLTVRNVGSLTATAISAGALGDGFSYGSGGSYPGPGGTCGTTLASGATCTIGIVFTPPSPGGHGTTLVLSYNDGTGAASAQRALMGTGISTALLTVRDWPGDGGGTDKPPYDFGQNGTSADHQFQVTNDGALQATSIHAGPGLGNGFAYKGGTFPGQGGTCGATLAVGSSCYIVVTFTPPGTGIYSSTIKVEYLSNGTGSIMSALRPVTGTGISTALLQISQWGPGGSDDGSYDYGTFGAPVSHTFYVTNTGAVSATAIADGGTLGNDFAYAGGSYPGTGGGDCGTTLAKGATCTLVVTFTPVGSGARGSTITLEYNDGGNPGAQVSKGLMGSAISGPLLRVYDWSGPGGGSGTPPPFDYGTWGVSVYHQFTITNDGNAAAANIADGATLGGNFAYQGGTYPGTNGDCGTSLASGASCTISVAFTPTGSGPRSSKITLNYTDSTAAPQPAVVRDIMGTATLGALLSLWDASGGGCGEGCGPYSYNSVSVGATGEAAFNIGNNGAVNATIMGDGGLLALPFKYKGGTYPGQGGNCGATLAPNNSCVIVVVFAPLTVGSANGTVNVKYNDGLGATQYVSRSLSGTAVP